MTKISVLGAGAIGSLFGGLIRRSDPEVEVLLVARGRHGQAMSDLGSVLLDGSRGTCQVPVAVAEDACQIAGSDLIILTVKSQDTLAAIEQAKPYLGSAVVASLQNGVNQRVLGELLAPEQFVVGMTSINAAIVEPGRVSLQRDGVTVVGSMNGPSGREIVADALKLLRKSGLRIESSDNIIGVQLNKIAINTIGYASVLSDSDFLLEGVLHEPWRTHVAKPLLDESLACIAAAGIELERVPGPSDVRRFRRLLSLLDIPLLGRLVAWGVRASSKRRLVYSLYQDLKRRRSTEIDYVNGEIANLAKSNGTAAPLNEKVVELVRSLEQRGDGSFFQRDEVVAALRQIDGAVATAGPTPGGAL
ncbi:MAG: 2-dehydropantoate 2-reductase [Planctomycetota bacterium]